MIWGDLESLFTNLLNALFRLSHYIQIMVDSKETSAEDTSLMDALWKNCLWRSFLNLLNASTYSNQKAVIKLFNVWHTFTFLYSWADSALYNKCIAKNGRIVVTVCYAMLYCCAPNYFYQVQQAVMKTLSAASWTSCGYSTWKASVLVFLSERFSLILKLARLHWWQVMNLTRIGVVCLQCQVTVNQILSIHRVTMNQIRGIWLNSSGVSFYEVELLLLLINSGSYYRSHVLRSFRHCNTIAIYIGKKLVSCALPCNEYLLGSI